MRPDAAAAARGLRAGLLLRVSTAAQAQRETPIERQEEETRRWCAERGLEVVERFADPGRSGGLDELSRAGLAALLAAADERRIDAVVMWSWSRLARDEDLAGHLRWMLRRAGVTCYSVSEPEEHPLLRAVGAWRDAEYRREQSRMMRSALARRSLGARSALARVATAGDDPGRGVVVRLGVLPGQRRGGGDPNHPARAGGEDPGGDFRGAKAWRGRRLQKQKIIVAKTAAPCDSTHVAPMGARRTRRIRCKSRS